MGDLIFVPELGLIAGKSQNLKVRMWYPLPPSVKQRMPTAQKLKRKQKVSPFIETQRLLPLRNQTQSPKRLDQKCLPTALEANLQPRPFTKAAAIRPRHSAEPIKTNDENIKCRTGFSNDFDVKLQPRPFTMIADMKPKLSLKLQSQNKIEYEDFSYINALDISLQARPLTMAGGRRPKFNNDIGNNIVDQINLSELHKRPS